jgi:thiol-disulfide isomerase/thioredoxin
VRRELWLLLVALAACDGGKKVHKAVPEEFRAITLTDDVLDRGSLAGRPWVISVWRPECAPCMRQLATLDAMKKKYEPKGVGFVALSLETDEDKIFEAAAHAEVDSQLAYGEEVMGPLGLKTLPSTVFIDSDATIVASLTGEGDAAAIEKWLKVAVP